MTAAPSAAAINCAPRQIPKVARSACNLAAISAALAAGPEAGPDKGRRWLAGISTGCTHLVLGGLSAGLVTAVLVAPDGVVAAVAGVALVGAFASACAGAMADADARLPAAITFLVAASGVADKAEYAMRAMAAATQSRYLFLTDDSGVGNPHAPPAIDCYLVTRLDALVRLALRKAAK